MKLPIEVFEAALGRPEKLIKLLRSGKPLTHSDRIALAMHFEKNLNRRGAKPKYLRPDDPWDKYRARAEVFMDFGGMNQTEAAVHSAREALKNGDVSENYLDDLKANIINHFRRVESERSNRERGGDALENVLVDEFRLLKEAQRNKAD